MNKETVCNILRSSRRSSIKYVKQNCKKKTISIPIDIEDSKKISDVLRINFNKKTGNFSLGFSLYFMRNHIPLSGYKHIHNCNDPQTIEIITKRCESVKKWKMNNREKVSEYQRNYYRNHYTDYKKELDDTAFEEYMNYLESVPE